MKRCWVDECDADWRGDAKIIMVCSRKIMMNVKHDAIVEV